MECGGQCVTLAGVAVMPESCADNWGSLDQVLRVMVLFHPSTLMFPIRFCRSNSTIWLSAQLWTRNWPSISVSCGMFWDRVFSFELQSLGD